MTEDWSRWYRSDYANTPETCFIELGSQLPAHIEHVIDFGCAAGRNLAVFHGRYRLHGVDLVARDAIDWLVPGGDVDYTQSPLQRFRTEGSLDKFLCISHGAIMYLPPDDQVKLIGYLLGKGCRNFILQEYDPETLRRGNYVAPTLWNRLRRRNTGYAFVNPHDFEKRWFRPAIPAWIRLDRR